MARVKANEAVRSKAKPNPVDELTRGIATLRELSVQIDDLSRDGFPYREAVRARTELSFRETIRRLFGEKSPEYQTHKNHKLKVGTRAESAQSTALLKEFIAALEIQKAELLGLTPEDVIAVVATEPSPPSLTVVPPTTPPDLTAMPSATHSAPPAAVSVPIPLAPSTIASATVNPPPSSPAPSSAAAPIVAPSPSIPATETVPPHANDAPTARAIPPPVPVGSASGEAVQVPPLSSTLPPITLPPPPIGVASAAPPVSHSTAKIAAEAPIPTTTIPPLASAMNPVPQGTIPPVPHTTLRPRPAPVVSADPPAPAQPIVNVLPTLTPMPAPAPEPPQQVAPSPVAPTTASSPVPPPEIRTAPPLVQTMAPTTTSTIPAPQPEPPVLPSVAQAPGPIRSSPPVSPQIPILDKLPEAKPPAEHGTLDILRRVCARFHLVARQLRLRKEYRPTLEINDEYDLQDLFYALLRLQFDEVGTEEWTPAYTNGAPRTSYLLDWEKTVVVVKQTRSGLTTRDLAEQIAADTARYSARPNGATFVCFVYDPDGRVGNPRGLEADLSSTDGGYRIEVIVAPK